MAIEERLAVSPCSNPEMGMEEALRAYGELGFRKFEAFTGWVKSSIDYHGDAKFTADLARRKGFRYSSVHLPPVGDDMEETLPRAVQAARFAEAIGAKVVLFKATSRENYIRAGRKFLDAIEGINVTPVLQNHSGAAIGTLDNYREVIEGIDDERMKALLEVGHFHSVGVSWREGYDLLGDKIELIHIKDQIGAQSVPFGTGEIDLPGLFAHMRSVGYAGDYVVEMEVKDRENTLRYLGKARDYIIERCGGSCQ